MKVAKVANMYPAPSDRFYVWLTTRCGALGMMRMEAVMKRRRALVLAFLMLVTFCVSPVAFAEEESSAEEYLRLGVVAERVERDPDKAAVLYLRAMAGGDAPVAAEAGWRMARLQERMGVPSAALQTLRSIQARFGDAMTPERVQEVETAIARLEAPKVTPTTIGSPLEIKLRAMFDRVEMASGDAASSEMNFVRTGLASVGKAALPLLEKMALERTPKTATLAAEMYATIGGADAIEGLERMAIAADPLTRPLVVQAFYELPQRRRDLAAHRGRRRSSASAPGACGARRHVARHRHRLPDE